MANTFIKTGVVAKTALKLLFRELVVARTLWVNPVGPDDFVKAKDDTVTIRVPAKRTARTRVLRGTGGARLLVLDESSEFGVDVKLDTDVYNGAPITDEELTLDIVDFAEQVLLPQVQAVAEGVEDVAVTKMLAATYTEDIEIDEADPYVAAVEARKVLNDRNVPKNERFMLVGSGVEAAMLLSDRFVRADNRGDRGASTAFEDAIVGRVGGFTVLQSNALPEDEAIAYVRSAFALAARTPKIPKGASFGENVPLSRAEGAQVGASMGGLAVRWIMDYDSMTATDRSFTSTYVGAAVVEDPDDFSDPESAKSLLRAVKLHLPTASV